MLVSRRVPSIHKGTKMFVVLLIIVCPFFVKIFFIVVLNFPPNQL